MGLTPDRHATLLLENISTLLNEIPTPDDLTGLRSPTLQPSHTTPPPGTLPHGLDAITDDWETGTIRTRQGCEDILVDVQNEWADKLGYHTPDGRTTTPVAEWLADHTEHAHKLLDADTWNTSLAEFYRVHTIASHLAGYDPEPTGHSCPIDGAMTVRYPFEDGFSDWITCPACGHIWTPTQLAELTHAAAITAAHRGHPYWIPARHAALITHIPYTTVRAWIARGHLTKQHGKINLAQVLTHAVTFSQDKCTQNHQQVEGAYSYTQAEAQQ